MSTGLVWGEGEPSKGRQGTLSFPGQVPKRVRQQKEADRADLKVNPVPAVLAGVSAVSLCLQPRSEQPTQKLDLEAKLPIHFSIYGLICFMTLRFKQEV